MTEDKLKQLEEKNKALEANIQALTAMNAQGYGNQLQTEDEIDLKELWNAIWDGKWLIAGITSLFAIASVIYALSLPNEYKSTALLAPASNSSAPSLSKLAGQFGGLASLAGINLGGAGGDDKTTMAMEIIKTWGFLENFIEENNIQVEVFAAKGWNRSTNTLIIDDELYDINTNTWVRDFDPDKGQTAQPSSWELFEEFKDRVSVSQSKDSGLVSISVEYYSPILAKQWSDKLVESVNKHIQEQDRLEATKSIEYLNRKISEISNTDMQTVFYQLIEEQTKTLMLAEVSDEYVFKTVSEAKVAEEQFKPHRLIVVFIGLVLGVCIALIIVLYRKFIVSTLVRKNSE